MYIIFILFRYRAFQKSWLMTIKASGNEFQLCFHSWCRWISHLQNTPNCGARKIPVSSASPPIPHPTCLVSYCGWAGGVECSTIVVLLLMLLLLLFLLLLLLLLLLSLLLFLLLSQPVLIATAAAVNTSTTITSTGLQVPGGAIPFMSNKGTYLDLRSSHNELYQLCVFVFYLCFTQVLMLSSWVFWLKFGQRGTTTTGMEQTLHGQKS